MYLHCYFPKKRTRESNDCRLVVLLNAMLCEACANPLPDRHRHDPTKLAIFGFIVLEQVLDYIPKTNCDDSVCGLKIMLPLLSMMSQEPGDAGGRSVRNKAALATSEVAAQADKSTA
jgi:hypothetical protein